MAPTALADKTTYPQCTLTKTTRALTSGKGKCTIYELHLHNRPDNRITPDFVQKSILPALDDVENDWRQMASSGGGAAALVTYGPRDADRFYSNGLDLPLAVRTPLFFPRILNALFARFLTFPIPTVAALNGHAFAGGFCMALAHDFRVMKNGDGKGQIWLCMNEVHFGASMPTGMMSILKAKLTNPQTIRKVILQGDRIGASEALALGIVDDLAGTPQKVVDKAVSLGCGMADRARAGVWGSIKIVQFRETLSELATDKGNDGISQDALAKL